MLGLLRWAKGTDCYTEAGKRNIQKLSQGDTLVLLGDGETRHCNSTKKQCSHSLLPLYLKLLRRMNDASLSDLQKNLSKSYPSFVLSDISF